MKGGGPNVGQGTPKAVAVAESLKAGGQANGHANGTATNGAASNGNGHAAKAGPTLLERAGIAPKFELRLDGGGTRSEQFATFQVDAPSCDKCGAITVRNGNCYLCHNCGNSMGCS